MQFFNNITNIDFEQTICKGSALSVFTLIRYFGRIQISPQRIEKLASVALRGPDMINEVLDIFNEMKNSSTFDLDATIPKYFRNPYDKKYQKPAAAEAESNAEPENEKRTTDQSSSRAETTLPDQLDLFTKLLKQLNNLKNFKPEDCPVQRFDDDPNDVDQILVDSTTKSCFCQNIYSIIDRISNFTSQLFSQLKPLFLGKVLYR